MAKFKIGDFVITPTNYKVEEILTIRNINPLPFEETEYRTASGWFTESEIGEYKPMDKLFYDDNENVMGYVDIEGAIYLAEENNYPEVASDKYIGAALAYCACAFGSTKDFHAWVDKLFDKEFKVTPKGCNEPTKAKYEVGQRVLFVYAGKEQMATVENVSHAGSEYVYIVSNDNYSSLIICEEDIIRKCRACNSKKEN